MVGDYPVPPAFREAIEAKYRLNDPLPVRVGLFLANLAHGDLGFSYQNQRAVLDLILERAPAHHPAGVARASAWRFRWAC